MKGDDIVTGIDIGSEAIKIVVADVQNPTNPTILGTGIAPNSGMRNGYITDLPQVVKCMNKALDNAVRSARVRPSRAYLSIGGISLSGLLSKGTAYVRHSDSIITDSDLGNAQHDATTKAEDKLLNKKTLHDIPVSHNIDGAKALCDPVGMRATRIDTDLMIVHALEQHIDDFVSAVEDSSVEVVDVTAAPLAASFATVGTPEKMQGCVLLDIGAESTDIVVFEDNMPTALKVLPNGSQDITNAIALELKIPTTEAEQIKRGGLIGGDHKQSKVDKIIEKHLNKMLTEVKGVLKTLKEDTMLPAGVLITGGGARLANIDKTTRDTLKLPTKVVYSTANKINGNPEFSVAYGLCIWGANSEQDRGILTNIKRAIGWITNKLRKFLP